MSNNVDAVRKCGSLVSYSTCQRLKVMALLAVFGAAGCNALLAKSQSNAKPNWDSFDSARKVYDQIVPYATTANDMARLGYDPYANPNIVILSYSDVIRRLIPAVPVESMKLDPGIVDCLAAQDACRAYEIDVKHLKRRRLGNFWLDFLNFKRRTEVTGWRFNALVLLKGEMVVHKLWGGQPVVREIEETVNPLGPLQSTGESIGGLAR